MKTAAFFLVCAGAAFAAPVIDCSAMATKSFGADVKIESATAVAAGGRIKGAKKKIFLFCSSFLFFPFSSLPFFFSLNKNKNKKQKKKKIFLFFSPPPRNSG